jgi:hypothetical protein
MRWEAVNAMTFESATHRVRRVGNLWFAELKSNVEDPCLKIGCNYPSQLDAQQACEIDAYRRASGR